MFRGINAVSIDAKGRIAMPVRLRDDLGESSQRVVMTIDTDERCLLLYPTAIWKAIEEKLADLPSFNPQARRIQRLLVGHATEIDLDSHGRILLPPLLREYAGLDKSVILVGQGRKLECWDEGHWQDMRAKWLAEEANQNAALLPDEVKSLSL